MAAKVQTITWKAFFILLFVAIGMAVNFRFPVLEKRPMHADEAVLGMKFIEFWNTGQFKYDPADYHGPGLHHLTRAAATVARWSPDSLTDTKLRIVTAICGLLLLLATFLAGDVLGRLGVVVAMLLLAASPMQVYYSRYFIMEAPLALAIALFLAGCWRYSQSKNALWLVLAGGSLGFAHATKETFILNLGAFGCGWIAARFVCGGFSPRPDRRLSLSRSATGVKKPWLWVLVAAVIVSVTLYSSFYTDWQAVADSVRTYGLYWNRAEGVGHEKPWHYYLGLIFWTRDGVVWTEALIAGLAIVGMAYAFLGQHRNPAHQAFLVFLSIYTLALFTVYSLLGYKTPWSILCAQHTLSVLAGVGGAAIWRWAGNRWARTLVAVLIGAGVWHLCQQCYLAIHIYRAGPHNPYAYSHTLPSLMGFVDQVGKLEALQPDAFSLQVINREWGWPLPWYFRRLKNAGYPDKVPDQPFDASVIIYDSDQQAALDAVIASDRYELAGHAGMRPGTPLLNMLVEKSLWDQYRKKFLPNPDIP